MNGDTSDVDAEQLAEQYSGDSDELDRQLADDTDATIERLGHLISIDSETEMMTPFGSMTESDLLGMVRPSLWQWVGSHRDTAIASIALIHRATGDLLERHAPDRDVDELVDEALEQS